MTDVKTQRAEKSQHAQHPRLDLSEELVNPVRFSIIAMLAKTGTLSFREVREALQVSDSALSKQVSSLESAGFVEVRKEFFGKTPRTLLSVTSEGRTAWSAHLAALQRIVDSQL
jgi:DNA-binding MarR family transcriptional regulator